MREGRGFLMRKKSLWWIVLIAFLGGLAGLLFSISDISTRVIFGLREDFRHAVAYQEVPNGIPGIRAQDCGVCHQEIYEEWKSSIHANAYVDPFFQAYWNKDEHIWICLNCHSPLENQQPWIIHGLVDENIKRPIRTTNARYDQDFQLEGITCAACHMRNGVIEGPFDDSRAPHPTRYSTRFRSTDICYTCHQVPSGPFQFYNGGPCSTFPEFVAGPYSKKGYLCQTCHMPEVVRPMATGGPVREGRRHLWKGGHDPAMIKQAVSIELVADPPEFKAGKAVKFILKFNNSGAGHKVPTGDPDRHFNISFTVTDQRGRVMALQDHTIGRWILWRPVIVELYDNRIAPQESRDYAFTTQIPPDGKSLVLYVSVKYHILTEKAYNKLQTQYGLAEEVPYVFTIYEQEIPLRGGLKVREAEFNEQAQQMKTMPSWSEWASRSQNALFDSGRSIPPDAGIISHGIEGPLRCTG